MLKEFGRILQQCRKWKGKWRQVAALTHLKSIKSNRLNDKIESIIQVNDCAWFFQQSSCFTFKSRPNLVSVCIHEVDLRVACLQSISKYKPGTTKRVHLENPSKESWRIPLKDPQRSSAILNDPQRDNSERWKNRLECTCAFQMCRVSENNNDYGAREKEASSHHPLTHTYSLVMGRKMAKPTWIIFF